MPAISIIVPFFNRHRLIEESVSSALDQTMTDIEVVIVDDGSTTPLDRSHLGRHGTDGRVKIMRQENRGAGPARNSGLRMATGHYVFFLDSDDVLAPGGLEALWNASRNGAIDAVVGNWINFSADGQFERIKPVVRYRDSLANAVEGGWTTGSVILRRDLAPAVSETRMPWEMAECYIRALRQQTATLAAVDHDIIRIRQDTPGRLTHVHDHFEPLVAARFWQEMKASFPLNDERRCALDRMIFRYLFTLFHAGRRDELESIFASIDADRMIGYHWCERFSPPWFARWLGVPFGLQVQRLLHTARGAATRRPAH